MNAKQRKAIREETFRHLTHAAGCGVDAWFALVTENYGQAADDYQKQIRSLQAAEHNCRLIHCNSRKPKTTND